MEHENVNASPLSAADRIPNEIASQICGYAIGPTGPNDAALRSNDSQTSLRSTGSLLRINRRFHDVSSRLFYSQELTIPLTGDGESVKTMDYLLQHPILLQNTPKIRFDLCGEIIKPGGDRIIKLLGVWETACKLASVTVHIPRTRPNRRNIVFPGMLCSAMITMYVNELFEPCKPLWDRREKLLELEHREFKFELEEQHDSRIEGSRADLPDVETFGWAVKVGSLALVTYLLDNGNFDISQPNDRRDRFLWLASGSGRIEIVKLLCDRLLNIIGKDRFQLELHTANTWAKSTPLWIASDEGHLSIVEHLLQVEDAFSEQHHLNSKKETPLMAASTNGHLEIVQLLCQRNSDPDAADDTNTSPLYAAATNGHESVTEFLIGTKRVDVNRQNKYGFTPATTANVAIRMQLIDSQKLKLDRKGFLGRTLLIDAAEEGQSTVVKQIVDTGRASIDLKDDASRSPFWYAASHGHLSIMKYLLDTKKVDVNAKDFRGRTPIWIAASAGHVAAVKLILDTGAAEIDRKDRSLRSPFWIAASKGHHLVLELLNPHDVDKNGKDLKGDTALHASVRAEKVLAIAWLLANVGVDRMIENKLGHTAYDMARMSQRADVIKLVETNWSHPHAANAV